MISADDEAFLSEIQKSPYDDTPRFVYADWLEERGDPRAEYLRLECEIAALQKGDALFKELQPRLHELRQNLDVRWIAAVGRTKVGNCGTFAFACPQRWEKLKKTGNPRQRHCDVCHRTVYYCETGDDVKYRALRGECVAIDTLTKMTTEDWVKLDIERNDGMLLGDLVFPDEIA